MYRIVVAITLHAYFFLSEQLVTFLRILFDIMNILLLKIEWHVYIWKSESLEKSCWQSNYFTQTNGSVGGDHTKLASPFEPSVASSREGPWLKIVWMAAVGCTVTQLLKGSITSSDLVWEVTRRLLQPVNSNVSNNFHFLISKSHLRTSFVSLVDLHRKHFVENLS